MVVIKCLMIPIGCTEIIPTKFYWIINFDSETIIFCYFHNKHMDNTLETFEKWNKIIIESKSDRIRLKIKQKILNIYRHTYHEIETFYVCICGCKHVTASQLHTTTTKVAPLYTYKVRRAVAMKCQTK